MKSASFFLLAALPLCAQVKITQHTDRISIDIDGKPFTEMFVGAETTQPYLHPLRAASATPPSAVASFRSAARSGSM